MTITGGNYQLNFDNGTKYLFGDNLRIQTISDINGNQLEFLYDENGNTIEKRQKTDVDAENNETDIVTTYIYNQKGQLTKQTDPEGNETNFIYSGGNLIETIKGTGDTIHEYFTYDKYGNILSTTDGEGNTTNLSYDDFSRMIKSYFSHKNLLKK